MAFGFKGNPADDDVQTQIANEHQHVVKHDGIGRGMQHDVEHALGLTKVNHDEQGAHDHGRNGHEFAKNDHALEFFIVVEVRGQHQHNGRGGNTDEVGELRNIQPPRNVAVHAGYGKTVLELIQIHNAAACDQAEQKEQPQVVGLGTFEQFFNHGLSSLYEVVNAGLRAQVGLAANTVVGGQSLPHR